MAQTKVTQAIPKVLVICKCPDTGPVWAFSLQQKQIQVFLETSIANAMQRWEEEVPDLIILDSCDAGNLELNLIKEFRQETSLPILLLTPRREEEYLLEAYRSGADECILKPVSPAMFMAKTRSWLRRCWMFPSSVLEPIKAGKFHLIPSERSLVRDDEAPMRLTNLEFRLMYAMMSHSDRVVNADELIEHVWGYTGDGDHAMLKNIVYRLRRKIEADPAKPRYILTVAGVGYRFVKE